MKWRSHLKTGGSRLRNSLTTSMRAGSVTRTLQTWVCPFKTLLNPTEDLPTQRPTPPTDQPDGKVDGDILHQDEPFTEEEVERAVKKLNEGKATFLASVDNTVIKCLQTAQPTFLDRLFSEVLISGNFPKDCARAYLSPLHKKGSKNDPQNNRGIAISACLSKVYNSVIKGRLKEFRFFQRPANWIHKRA